MTAPRVEPAHAGQVLWLDNGLLRLGVVPGLGGRLLSVRLLAEPAREMLWRNDELVTEDLLPRRPGTVSRSGELGAWLNYGGDKTWPAPQGWECADQWPGPPDPVLDSGSYPARSESSGDHAAITMTSADDPRTGLRLTRRVELRRGRRAYRLELTAVNVSSRPVRWSLWNVTQLPGVGTGATYVGSTGEPTELIAGTGYPQWTHEAAERVRVPHQDVVGKLGFPAGTGWLAHVGTGGTMTFRYPVTPGAEYPDGGARAEVWLEHPVPAPLAHLGALDPPDRIVECEILGPLATLAPGEATTLTLDCGVASGDAPVTGVSATGHWTESGDFVAYQARE